MADTTISELTQSIPNGNNILPYSTGSNTLGVPVSAILQNVSKVGIGTNNPTTRLHIYGGHGDTLLRMYSTGGGGTGSQGPATLSLWASEPAATYTGAGIGANVNDSPYFGRVDSTNGQSYIRFLPSDGTMRFFTGLGDAPQGMMIDSNGSVGIGITPSAKLDVYGDLKVSGNIIGIPAFKLFLDTTNNNRTSPVGFVKSYTETFYSRGGIHIANSGYSGGSTLMFEMTVNSNAVRTVTQFLKGNDDRVSFFWNGFLQSTYNGGTPRAAINWNLTVGNNLIQIILGDEGGGAQVLDLFGDIISPGVTFVS